MPSGEGEYDSLILKVRTAIKVADLDTFQSCINSKMFNKHPDFFSELATSYDLKTKNTVFHDLLTEDSSWWSFNKRKKRRSRTQMFYELMEFLPTLQITAPLNFCNTDGVTPFHQAIKLGYTGHVDKMIEAGVDVSVAIAPGTLNAGMTPLELAVKNNKSLYETLLDHHTKINNDSETPLGYTTEAIEKTNNIYLGQLKKKQINRGILAAIMMAACPLGTLLAFTELPVLGFFVSSLIPGVGPFIGLAIAVVFGVLLFSSIYHKTSFKYGAHGQEMASLKASEAKIKRLEAELKDISSKLNSKEITPGEKTALQQSQTQIKSKLSSIYSTVKGASSRHEALPSDWVTTGDKVKAYMLTAASFLCAFSGLLGVIGAVSGFMPAAALPVILTSVVFAGVPVLGWCALAAAIIVGFSVAIWAYHVKFKPALVQCGNARKELHEKKTEILKLSKIDDEKVQGYGYGKMLNVFKREMHPVDEVKPEVSMPPKNVVVFKKHIDGLNRRYNLNPKQLNMNEEQQPPLPFTV